MIDKWIETSMELKELKLKLGVRNDWHEPDEQDLTIEMVDGRFDNAFGDESEAHVIITHTDPTYTVDDEVRYAVNAANLLAWASA